jgi:anti-sigma regulatory factor (Ser/Thr protein kinase)
MPEGLPAPVHLRLPTDLVFVRVARKMVEGLLRAQTWPTDSVDEVALVVTELLQNAIEHGSRNDGEECADLTLRLDPDAVVLEVIDPGTGSDPSQLLDRDVTQPVPLDAPRGRGLFLVNRLSCWLERARVPEGGCRVCARMEPESE